MILIIRIDVGIHLIRGWPPECTHSFVPHPEKRRKLPGLTFSSLSRASFCFHCYKSLHANHTSIGLPLYKHNWLPQQCLLFHPIQRLSILAHDTVPNGDGPVLQRTYDFHTHSMLGNEIGIHDGIFFNHNELLNFTIERPQWCGILYCICIMS